MGVREGGSKLGGGRYVDRTGLAGTSTFYEATKYRRPEPSKVSCALTIIQNKTVKR